MIDRSLGKIIMLVEKLDLLIEKNERLLVKATMKIKIESLITLCDNQIRDLGDQNSQSVKLEVKIRAHLTALQDKI